MNFFGHHITMVLDGLSIIFLETFLVCSVAAFNLPVLLIPFLPYQWHRGNTIKSVQSKKKSEITQYITSEGDYKNSILPLLITDFSLGS